MLKFILIAAMAASTMLAAGIEDEIRAAEKAWSEAVIQRDFAKLEKTFSPELIYAHSTGSVENLSEYIARLKQGKQRYDTMTYEKTKVNAYGQTAVAHSFVRFTGKNDSGAFNDHLMMMHVWVKKGAAWQLVAHQTTRIP